MPALVTLAAALALAQAAPADDPSTAAPEPPAGSAAQGEAEAPPPTPATPAPATPPAPAPSTPPASAPSTSAAAAPLPVPSLLAGRTLGSGRLALLAAAGFPLLSVTYGQGVSEIDDLGAFVDLDWVASEMVVGGLWRRALSPSGPGAVALRLRLGYYADFGATWAYSTNHSDHGIQGSGALAISWPVASGLATLGAELPLTATFTHGGGIVAAPKATAAYEAPIHGDVYAGARFGLGFRAAGGGAPSGGDARVLVELSALLGYRVF